MPARKERTISLATIDRIFLKAKCLPPDTAAAKSLGQLLEQIAGEILEATKALTKLARRKTITDADITLAFEHWRGNGRESDADES